MEDVIEGSRNGDELGDVIFDEGETFVPYEVEDILHVPVEKVIHADNLMSLPDTVFAEVESKKPPPPVISVLSIRSVSLICFFP